MTSFVGTMPTIYRVLRLLPSSPLRHALKSTALIVALLLLCIVAVQAEDLRNVPFAHIAGMSLTLDAHIPDGAGPFPAALLVHGGGWVAGDKLEYITYLFQLLKDSGVNRDRINFPPPP